jgi:hypothetical protein
MGQSALICACARGHTAIARTLLEAGADVHAKDEVSFPQFGVSGAVCWLLQCRTSQFHGM